MLNRTACLQACYACKPLSTGCATIYGNLGFVFARNSLPRKNPGTFFSPSERLHGKGMLLKLHCIYKGGSRNFDWVIQTLVQKGLLTFLWQITSLPIPLTLSHQSRLHVIIPWPLTVYLNSTRKGCNLGTSSSCTFH